MAYRIRAVRWNATPLIPTRPRRTLLHVPPPPSLIPQRTLHWSFLPWRQMIGWWLKLVEGHRDQGLPWQCEQAVLYDWATYNLRRSPVPDGPSPGRSPHTDRMNGGMAQPPPPGHAHLRDRPPSLYDGSNSIMHGVCTMCIMFSIRALTIPHPPPPIHFSFSPRGPGRAGFPALPGARDAGHAPKPSQGACPPLRGERGSGGGGTSVGDSCNAKMFNFVVMLEIHFFNQMQVHFVARLLPRRLRRFHPGFDL